MTTQTEVVETVDPTEQARAELARAGVNLGTGLAATTAAHLLEAVAGAPGAVVALTKMAVGWGRNIVILATVVLVVLMGFAMFFTLGRALLVGLVLAWLASRVSGLFGWLVKLLVGAALFVLAWTALSPIAMPVIGYGLGVVERFSPGIAGIIDGREVHGTGLIIETPSPKEKVDLPSGLTIEQAAAFERGDVAVYVNQRGWLELHYSDIHKVIELPGNATQVSTIKGFAVAGLASPTDDSSEIWRAQNGESKMLYDPVTRWVILKPYP